MSSASPDPLPPARALHLHNGTRAAGGLQYTTDTIQWGYALSFAVAVPASPGPQLHPAVVVEVAVIEGSIGVGLMDEALRTFETPETDVVADGRTARVELRPASSGAAHVMIRNTASGSRPSTFRLLSAAVEFSEIDRRLLVPVPRPDVRPDVHAAPRVTATVDILISHSSRVWDAAQCDQRYLRERYARPGRLDGLPPFDALPPNRGPYHGLLTIMRLTLSEKGLRSEVLQHYRSPEKLVHAAVSSGSEVIVCFDTGLAVFDRRDATSPDVVPERAEAIRDPWFGGLHTVIPAGDRTCLVSSSGADAVLWLDVPSRTVVRRWRLPAERYGTNYPLDDATWLDSHYIGNDLQLGHLNCAAPDGHGGAFYSVLGQGDIGHVDSAGRWTLLASGFVGCHGVRQAHGRIAFCDSCTGRLVQIDRGGTAVVFETGSRWLHDALPVAPNLFLMTLGDRNRLLLADIERKVAIAEWDFAPAGGAIQFLGVG